MAETPVSVECAHCGVYACRAGRLDATPDNCPMSGDFPPVAGLYTSQGYLRDEVFNASLGDPQRHLRAHAVDALEEAGAEIPG